MVRGGGLREGEVGWGGTPEVGRSVFPFGE